MLPPFFIIFVLKPGKIHIVIPLLKLLNEIANVANEKPRIVNTDYSSLFIRRQPVINADDEGNIM
jgi:hypothetical protein